MLQTERHCLVRVQYMTLESTVFTDINLDTLSLDAVVCICKIQVAVANLAYTANRKVLLGKGLICFHIIYFITAAWLTITAFAFGYWVSIMMQIYENSEVHISDLGNWWPVFCLTHKHTCRYFHRFSQRMGKRLVAMHIISLLPSYEKQFHSVHLTLTWSLLLLLHISTFPSDHTSLSQTRIRQKENKSQNVKIRDRWRHIFCFVFCFT